MDPLTQLLYEYNPGAFGIQEDASLDEIEKTIAGKEILWFESSKERSDLDLGINEEESSAVTLLTVCVYEKKQLLCPFQGPVADYYERDLHEEEEECDETFDDEYDIEACEEEIKEFEDLRTPGLPIRRKGRLNATLKKDGVLHLTLAEGQATTWLGHVIGRHTIWK